MAERMMPESAERAMRWAHRLRLVRAAGLGGPDTAPQLMFGPFSAREPRSRLAGGMGRGPRLAASRCVRSVTGHEIHSRRPRGMIGRSSQGSILHSYPRAVPVAGPSR